VVISRPGRWGEGAEIIGKVRERETGSVVLRVPADDRGRADDKRKENSGSRASVSVKANWVAAADRNGDSDKPDSESCTGPPRTPSEGTPTSQPLGATIHAGPRNVEWLVRKQRLAPVRPPGLPPRCENSSPYRPDLRYHVVSPRA
ncbi:hypothetical protein BaRGS_00000677, partial [Batillaria attramentaria]